MILPAQGQCGGYDHHILDDILPLQRRREEVSVLKRHLRQLNEWHEGPERDPDGRGAPIAHPLGNESVDLSEHGIHGILNLDYKTTMSRRFLHSSMLSTYLLWAILASGIYG